MSAQIHHAFLFLAWDGPCSGVFVHRRWNTQLYNNDKYCQVKSEKDYIVYGCQSRLCLFQVIYHPIR